MLLRIICVIDKLHLLEQCTKNMCASIKEFSIIYLFQVGKLLGQILIFSVILEFKNAEIHNWHTIIIMSRVSLSYTVL
jgi:hypothetical protein